MDAGIQDLVAFIAAHSNWAGPILFVVCFGESLAVVSLVFPGTSALVAAGTLVQAHVVSLWPVLVCSILGATMGDAVSYWIGRACGHAVHRVWPFSRHPQMLRRSLDFFERHGGKSVFIGRFLGPLRAFVPLAAGMAAMPARRFWIANVASAVLWAPGVLVPGMVVGFAAEAAAQERYVVVIAASSLLILGVVGFAIARRRIFASSRPHA
jgi:membrane protein DedA with SNARE-associated domain